MKRRSVKSKKAKVRDGKLHQSRYARKKEYLHRKKLWGFEVPEPKPWK